MVHDFGLRHFSTRLGIKEKFVKTQTGRNADRVFQ